MKFPDLRNAPVLPAIILFCSWPALSLAQAPTPEEIVIIAPGGATLDERKVPYPVQHTQAEDLQTLRSVSIADLQHLGPDLLVSTSTCKGVQRA